MGHRSFLIDPIGCGLGSRDRRTAVVAMIKPLDRDDVLDAVPPGSYLGPVPYQLAGGLRLAFLHPLRNPRGGESGGGNGDRAAHGRKARPSRSRHDGGCRGTDKPLPFRR